jgi:hypothetical protein
VFAKYIFSVDHVYGSNDNTLKLNEDEENDWHILPTPKPLSHDM